MLKHWKSRVSTLTLICRNGFLRIKVRVKNLRPAGHPGRARLCFWKAGFPQSGPAVSEKAWVSPAVPKVGRTGRLGTLGNCEKSPVGDASSASLVFAVIVAAEMGTTMIRRGIVYCISIVVGR